MFKENGRLKNKSKASVTNFKVLVCTKCGFKLNNTHKEFGEVLICPNCTSTDLEYKYEGR